jgi:hypothetical protein
MDLIFHCLSILSVLAKHVTYMNLGMHDLRGKRFFGGRLAGGKIRAGELRVGGEKGRREKPFSPPARSFPTLIFPPANPPPKTVCYAGQAMHAIAYYI